MKLGEKKQYYQKKRRGIGMKQRWKKSIAYIMSFCMLFGIMQTAAWVTPVYAETQSMTWSVEFQTTDTKLLSLLALENSGNYLALFYGGKNFASYKTKMVDTETGLC